MNVNKKEMDRLINENMGLVKVIVKKFRPKTRQEFDEMIQCGRIGLWKGLKGYDPSVGKLSTFCYRPITWEIYFYLRSKKNRSKKEKNRVYNTNIDKISDSATAVSIEEVLPEMTEEQKAIIHDLSCGMTHKEIGLKNNLTATQVKNRINKFFEVIREANA